MQVALSNITRAAAAETAHCVLSSTTARMSTAAVGTIITPIRAPTPIGAGLIPAIPIKGAATTMARVVVGKTPTFLLPRPSEQLPSWSHSAREVFQADRSED